MSFTVQGSTFDNSNLDIGTTPGGNNVIKDGVPQPKFKMCEVASGVACPVQALYSVSDVFFYISSKDFETLGVPSVTPKFPASVKATIIGAQDMKEKVVLPDDSIEIQIHMECLRDGVTSPVLVDIPFGYGVHHASFSIVKVGGVVALIERSIYDTTISTNSYYPHIHARPPPPPFFFFFFF